MAVLLPMGLEPVRKPTSGVAGVLFGSYLFVNPEKIRLRRSAKIAEVRTMAGTVFQPWTNTPDEISLEGVLYGLRAFHEFKILSDAIDKDPQYKEVNFVYKFRKYRGFVKDISISADADKPRVFAYTINFVSKDAVELHRMLIGQLDTVSAETSFVDGQIRSVFQTFMSPDGLKADNVVNLVAIGAMGYGGMSSAELTKAATRLATLAAVFSIRFLRKNKGAKNGGSSGF